MTVKLNHTIVFARDKQASAAFFSEVLGLPAPVVMLALSITALVLRLATL